MCIHYYCCLWEEYMQVKGKNNLSKNSTKCLHLGILECSDTCFNLHANRSKIHLSEPTLLFPANPGILAHILANYELSPNCLDTIKYAYIFQDNDDCMLCNMRLLLTKTKDGTHIQCSYQAYLMVGPCPYYFTL